MCVYSDVNTLQQQHNMIYLVLVLGKSLNYLNVR